jgi:hypothetical protein
MPIDVLRGKRHPAANLVLQDFMYAVAKPTVIPWEPFVLRTMQCLCVLINEK